MFTLFQRYRAVRRFMWAVLFVAPLVVLLWKLPEILKAALEVLKFIRES